MSKGKINFRVDVFDGVTATGTILRNNKFVASLDVTVPSSPSESWLREYTYQKLREMIKEFRL